MILFLKESRYKHLCSFYIADSNTSIAATDVRSTKFRYLLYITKPTTYAKGYYSISKNSFKNYDSYSN